MYTLIHWVLSALAVLITSKVIKGFEVSGFFSALVAAVGIAFANFLLWWLFMFLTLPLNILTLGLFTFVVNGAILKVAATFLPGFEIKGWWAAILGAIVLTIVNAVLHWALPLQETAPVAMLMSYISWV